MKKGLKKILPGTGAVLLVLAGGVMAGAAGKEQEYIFPEVDKELLTEEDVKDLPAELLAYGRYEILAKHGELFESEELKEYFGNQEWYFGFLSDEKEVEGLLNDIEKENLAFLEKKEKAEGGYELDQKDFDYEIVKKWLEGTYVAGEETTRKTSEKKTKETEAAKTAETEAPATEALATEPATETPATEAPETEPVTEALAPEPATEAPTESVTETPETEEHVTDGKFEDLSDVDLFSLSQDELATTVREEPETEAESETESETETESEIEADTRSEYIFPDMDTRYLTQDEVSKLSLQAVCYAKNELYARHGRKFLSQELKDYFNDKTWYEGTVDPDSFSPGVFNTYENDNLLLLVSAEEKLLPGGYVLDQQGYDIHKVDTACKHTLGETAKTGDTSGYVFVVIDSDSIMHDDARLVNGKVVDANGNEIPGCYEREDGRVADALGNIINPQEGQLVKEESFKK
ncbi:MAG: YARHG domain-containing protein [Lachnospiraceae bacterium]|uniref:YARHG domain-containing protein n=1 Tax=Fusicatenibacter faecihominis TaxID=2881276 RepID=A0AAE3DQ02_9FIRM|nr:YARHG domain-containing protein [Fusicatenibacter faecihominis]MCC2188260.1 YARHG domain-containing protein [Fusicatenibacter faecihominis]